ncbi:multidrug efflux SMR transporter [Streptomyces prasinosporus]
MHNRTEPEPNAPNPVEAVTVRGEDTGGRHMAWLLVVVAGLLETGFAVCLKLSHGFTRLWPTIAFCVFALGSFGLLTLSLKKLDVGPAYAVWTGIGAAGTAIYGMVFLGDLVSTLKIVSITLVIVGVIGLQLSGSAH